MFCVEASGIVQPQKAISQTEIQHSSSQIRMRYILHISIFES